jgi:hypothetical protein
MRTFLREHKTLARIQRQERMGIVDTSGKKNIRLYRIRLLGLLFLFSIVALCLRSVWLVSFPYDQQQQYRYHEWRAGDAATTENNLTMLLNMQAQELSALRRVQKSPDEQLLLLQIAKLSTTIQQQTVELETLRRIARRDQQQMLGVIEAPISTTRREQEQKHNKQQHKSSLASFAFNAEHYSSSRAIFYNIYIPPPEDGEMRNNKNTEKMDNALRIIQEQIAQVKASFAVHPDSRHRTSDKNDKKTTTKQVVVPLFYNTIGHALNTTWMNQLCGGSSGSSSSSSDNHDRQRNNNNLSLDCIFLKHYDTPGVFEDVTLQRVLDYCQQSPDDDDNGDKDVDKRTVIYMHSKGSFNARDGSNDVWRRHLTNAVTSRECIVATTTTSTATPRKNGTTAEDGQQPPCNLCGLLFNPMPGMHFPGNFFTARCSYIRRLPPPLAFQQAMQERVVPQVLSRRLRKTFDFNLYPALDPWMHGFDRWAFEWWIASHPSVVPCDVSIQTSIYPFKEASNKKADSGSIADAHAIMHNNNDDPLTTFAWAMAPRFSYRDGNWDYTTGASRRFVMRKPERRRTEYALLAGHLFRWNTIYNNGVDHDVIMKPAAEATRNKAVSTLVMPPDDSWIWEWYVHFVGDVVNDRQHQLGYCQQTKKQTLMLSLSLVFCLPGFRKDNSGGIKFENMDLRRSM